MTFLRMTIFALASVLPLPRGTQAQSTIDAPRFEVASVRENPSDTTESNLNHSLSDRFIATNVPLLFLILDAYEIKAHQLVGAPDWISNKSYDILATFSAGIRPRPHQVHLMEQQLLVERFGLKIHSEQRDVPAYDLILANADSHLGPQIHKSSLDCSAWAANGRPRVDASTSPVAPAGERPTCNLVTTRTWLSGGERTIQDLAGSLEAMLDRPVLDKTGLTGTYDMDLHWARTDLHAGDDASSAFSDAPPLFNAVKEQLGLKLVPHREVLGVLVIDRIQAPTPN